VKNESDFPRRIEVQHLADQHHAERGPETAAAAEPSSDGVLRRAPEEGSGVSPALLLKLASPNKWRWLSWY
jgi:hypothetical protein